MLRLCEQGEGQANNVAMQGSLTIDAGQSPSVYLAIDNVYARAQIPITSPSKFFDLRHFYALLKVS